MSSERLISWEELSRHNTLESAWVAVGGDVYDVTAWAPSHPGGDDYIRLAAGRDITDLFHSYHPFSTRHEAVLPKYKIGRLKETELNTFKPDSGFYRELRGKVKAYFDHTGLHHKDPLPGLARLLVVLLVMGLAYAVMYDVVPLPTPIKFLFCVVFGLCEGIVLLQMMHDASHSSIGYSQTYWRIIGRLTLDWIAAGSLTSWYHQHVLGHHVYTNIMGADPDLPYKDEGDLRYIVSRQIWTQLYEWQHLYMPLAYGLLGIKVRLQDLTWTFGSLSNGAIRVNPLSTYDYVFMIATKVFHVLVRFILPRYYFGVAWSSVLLIYLVSELTVGYYLAFNFQVSHVSTDAFFPEQTLGKKAVDHEWAILQVITALDYAHDSPLVNFFSGHLNYQIEHHLFPSVSQYHYPAIAPIVREHCKKHGVPYNYVPSFYDAMSTHIQYLYRMGNKKEVRYLHHHHH